MTTLLRAGASLDSSTRSFEQHLNSIDGPGHGPYAGDQKSRRERARGRQLEGPLQIGSQTGPAAPLPRRSRSLQASSRAAAARSRRTAEARPRVRPPPGGQRHRADHPLLLARDGVRHKKGVTQGGVDHLRGSSFDSPDSIVMSSRASKISRSLFRCDDGRTPSSSRWEGSSRVRRSAV